MEQIKIDHIAAALGKAQPIKGGWICCCPVHRDINPSLSMAIGEDKKLLMHCFAGCAFADILRELLNLGLLNDAYLRGRGMAKVAKDAKAKETYGFESIKTKLKHAKIASIDKQIQAQSLWQRANKIEHTLAEAYLRSRGITCALPPSLRFIADLPHKPTQTIWPSMIAAVKRWPGEGIVAIHRTYVNRQGTGKAPIAPAKMMLAPCMGGAVRMGEDLSHLVITEGIENALTIYQETGKTAWSALSATNMENLILPPLKEVQLITICADRDDAGKKAAKKAALKWVTGGYKVRISYPPAPFKDFNDILLEENII